MLTLASPPPRLHGPAARAEFRRRRRMQLPITAAWVLYSVLVTAVGKPPGLVWIGLMLGGFVLLHVAAALTWRCPRCDRHLGRWMNPHACPHCGIVLDEGKVPELGEQRVRGSFWNREHVAFEMMTDDEVLRYAYAAFNARNIDAALATMHPDVDWPNGMEGGRVAGHQAVREYWTRQWTLVDPRVEPLSFTRTRDGRIAVEVRQVVRDREGSLLVDQRVRHVYRMENGQVRSMEIVEEPG